MAFEAAGPSSMSRPLQGSHASRLAFAAVCRGSSVAWLLWALVASGRRLGWSPPASAGLLVGCFCGCCWSPVGLLVGVRGGRRDGSGPWMLLSFERGGRSADYAPAAASFCWSFSASVLASVLVGSSLGLRGVRADSLPRFEVATLRGGGLVSACFSSLLRSRR